MEQRKAAWITGFCTIAAAVITALATLAVTSIPKKELQNELSQAYETITSMQEKYEATIAVLQQNTIAESNEWKNFFKVAECLGGLRVVLHDYNKSNQYFHMNNNRIYTGISMKLEDVGTFADAFVRFKLNGDFSELAFSCGVLRGHQGAGSSAGEAIITFDDTTTGEKIDLASYMDVKEFRVAIPKGSKTIKFELVSDAGDGKRPMYAIGNICIR